jgi:hypothetical protein
METLIDFWKRVDDKADAVIVAYERSITPFYLESGIEYLYTNAGTTRQVILEGREEYLTKNAWYFKDTQKDSRWILEDPEIWFKIARLNEEVEYRNHMAQVGDYEFCEVNGIRFRIRRDSWKDYYTKEDKHRYSIDTPADWPYTGVVETNAYGNPNLTLIKKKENIYQLRRPVGRIRGEKDITFDSQVERLQDWVFYGNANGVKFYDE